MVARYPKSGGVVNMTSRLQKPAERTMLRRVTAALPGAPLRTDASRVGCARHAHGIRARMAAAQHQKAGRQPQWVIIHCAGGARA